MQQKKVHKHLERGIRLLKDLKIHGNQTFIFPHEISFTVDPAFNKQIDHVVTVWNDASEYRRVYTTKNPASIMIVGVVASNREKMPPV